MIKYVSAILLCICLTGFAASCDKPNHAASGIPSGNEKILRYDVNAPITSLHPEDVEASGSNHIFPLLYSYLFVPDAEGKLQPDLANSWFYDSTSFTWTVQLRNNARFHNQHPVLSKDIQYSIENNLKKIHPNLFFMIDRISIASDNEISIRLKKNDPEFPNKIWDTEIVLGALNHQIDFFKHPIGSGPFKFKYRKGEKKVVLEANEDYFLGRPSLDQIIFYFEPDKERSWVRLLSGLTDIAHEISPKNFEILQQYNHWFYLDQYTLPYYKILLYNTHDPLFSDPRVRSGLTYAINRKYLVENILRGYGKVALGPMGVDASNRNPEIKQLPFDPQKALSLLKEAGWSQDKKGRFLYKDRRPFEFSLLVFKESQIDKKVARYIQVCLNDLGIRVHLQALPFNDLFKRFYRNHQFQTVLAEFRSAFRNPEFLIKQWTPFLSTCSVAGCFEHPKVTYLIHRALEETDPLQQKQLLYQIDTLIASLQPGTFLFHQTAIDVMSKRFHLPVPFSLTHEGIHRLRYASINRN